jgi:putative transposase
MVITKQRFSSNGGVVYDCKYHIIWCPKYRRKVLIDGVDIRLKEIIHEFSIAHFAEIIELEIMPDHVHILCSIDPQYGVGTYIKLLKGYSSRLLRQEFPKLKRFSKTLWTHSYFVATVGGAPLEVIKQYIVNQKEA